MKSATQYIANNIKGDSTIFQLNVDPSSICLKMIYRLFWLFSTETHSDVIKTWKLKIWKSHSVS